MASSSLMLLLTFFACFIQNPHWSFGETTPFKVIDRSNPVIELAVSQSPKKSYLGLSEDVLSCERVQVAGISRFMLSHFFSAIELTLTPSVVIPERLHKTVHVCFHRNSTLGFCECSEDDWKPIQKGSWSSVISPYIDGYIDIKYASELPGPVTIFIKEEFQRWRLCFIVAALSLMLLAPLVSSWVPFYYSSSMVIGIFLVVIIILFQATKLLPTRSKSMLYFLFYGSVVGAGSVILQFISMLLNSVLSKFGLSKEMHFSVSVLVLVLILIVGAGLGFWIVRKFVVTEDGTVDNGIALFVKWAMHFIAASLVLQSSIDVPLAVGALGCCWIVVLAISSLARRCLKRVSNNGATSPSLWNAKYSGTKQNYTEFLSSSAKSRDPGMVSKGQNNKLNALPEPSHKGTKSWSRSRGSSKPRDFFSTFHKGPTRRKISQREYDEITQEYTQQALAEWAASPEFTNWVIDNAERIQVHSDDSSDTTIESGSDSTDEIGFRECDRLSSFRIS